MHLGALKTRKKKEHAAHLPCKALFLYCIVVYSYHGREKDKICICSLVAPRMKKGGWVDASPTGRYYYMFIDHLQFPPPQAQATSHD
jgi:hypothetical protein